MNRIVSAFPFVALLAVSACTDPQTASCPARKELQTVDQLTAETRAAIDRGYRMAPANRTAGVDLCLGGAHEGLGLSFCTDGTGREKAVAVDTASERRKLDGLRARRAVLVREMAATPGCVTTLPTE